MATTDIGRAVPLLRGEYDPAQTYELNDIVSLNGSLYWHYSHEVTTNVAPQATSTWKVVLSLTDAEGYIARAETAAEEAESAKDDAVTAKTAAETASATATGASEAATAAKDDAVTARNAAQTAETGAVEAKNAAVSAKEAAQSAASSANTSATNANNSAGTAEYYAENAGTAAETATTKASEASASAATASSAATTATGAKTAAETAASTATTKAGEASTSATSAASSAAAAQAVKDSIPEDYSALSEDVGDLKTQLKDNEIAINPFKINTTDQQKATAETNGVTVSYTGNEMTLNGTSTAAFYLPLSYNSYPVKGNMFYKIETNDANYIAKKVLLTPGYFENGQATQLANIEPTNRLVWVKYPERDSLLSRDYLRIPSGLAFSNTKLKFYAFTEVPVNKVIDAITTFELIDADEVVPQKYITPSGTISSSSNHSIYSYDFASDTNLYVEGSATGIIAGLSIWDDDELLEIIQSNSTNITTNYSKFVVVKAGQTLKISMATTDSSLVQKFDGLAMDYADYKAGIEAQEKINKILSQTPVPYTSTENGKYISDHGSIATQSGFSIDSYSFSDDVIVRVTGTATGFVTGVSLWTGAVLDEQLQYNSENVTSSYDLVFPVSSEQTLKITRNNNVDTSTVSLMSGQINLFVDAKIDEVNKIQQRTLNGILASYNSLSTGLANLKNSLNSNHLAENGYVLRATDENLDGFEWANAGTPTDEQTAIAVGEWLNEHPDATTTVVDGSITEQKLSETLKLKAINPYVTPEMFGAKCDGVTDDSVAMSNCVAYCVSNNILLYISENSVVYLPNKITFIGLKQIQIRGKLVVPNGVEFRYNSSQTGPDWYFYHVDGVLTLSGLKDGFITICNATELVLFADSTITGATSIAYTHFLLGLVFTVTIQGLNAGWINENYFYGGRIRYLTFADGGTYSHNHNHFFHNDFEAAVINFYTGRCNYLHNARFEGENTVTFQDKAVNNYVHVGYTDINLPGTKFLPSYFHDLNGNNFWYRGIENAVNTYEKTYTSKSLNYDANKLYPLNGKLHNVQNSKEILKTNIIDVSEHAVGIQVKSDQTFFRGYVAIYDSEMNRITNEPEHNPVYGLLATWDSTNGYYSFESSSRNMLNFSAGRYSVLDGGDTGVYYVMLCIDGFAQVDMDYLTVEVTVPNYIYIEPFIPDKLTAADVPNAGEWDDGTIVYNIDSSNHCLGWFYNNGAWHEIGTYTP